MGSLKCWQGATAQTAALSCAAHSDKLHSFDEAGAKAVAHSWPRRGEIKEKNQKHSFGSWTCHTSGESHLI